MKLELSEKDSRWRCRKNDCNEVHGWRKKTLFLENTNIPLDDIIFSSMPGPMNSQIRNFAKEPEINGKSSLDSNTYMREICAMALLEQPTIIGGIVEIDDSLFSRRKSNIGRVYPEQWVLGCYCRETKGSSLYDVPGRTASILIHIIRARLFDQTNGQLIVVSLMKSINMKR